MKTDTQNFTEFMQSYQQRIELYLEKHLPSKNTLPQRLHEAMHYAVLGKGKRLRPLLVYATGLCLNAQPKTLDRPAAAIELIHCYSLVHDDLPCMDNDDLRRGKPSCHKAFDESTALLVGDSLQSLAFQLLAEPIDSVSPTLQRDMITTLAAASGSLGMAGGQALDLQTKDKSLDTPLLEDIYLLKTGALIRACVRLGALAAGYAQKNAIPVGDAEPGGVPHELQQLDLFARYIGLAFQIQDDILDNYPAFTKLETTKKRVQELYQLALQALRPLAQDTQLLQQLSEKLVVRST